jgi:hypothetical protein
MNSDNWISIAALIVSLLALLYTYFTNTKRYELRSQYIKELTEWHAKTVEVLIRMKLYLNGCVTTDKNELLSQLSSLIEIGRLYFPNIDKKDNFGTEKPIIYQGHRNLILHFLVYSYAIFEGYDDKKYADYLEVLQKNFTSTFYEIVNPKEIIKEAKKYAKKEFYVEWSYKDFLKNDPNNIRKEIEDLRDKTKKNRKR